MFVSVLVVKCTCRMMSLKWYEINSYCSKFIDDHTYMHSINDNFEGENFGDLFGSSIM